jgi:hypothetical protein
MSSLNAWVDNLFGPVERPQNDPVEALKAAVEFTLDEWKEHGLGANFEESEVYLRKALECLSDSETH